MIKYLMKTWFIVFCFIIIYSMSQSQVYAEQKRQMVILIKASPYSESCTTLHIDSDIVLDQILKRSTVVPNQIKQPISDTYIQIIDRQGTKEYVYDDNGKLMNPRDRQILALHPMGLNILKSYIEMARQKHFGELKAWEEARKMIPKKSIFQVMDIETGLSFNVQRRAGNKHADVQPLTFTDTKIMKEIYKGKWSWDRRAILIHADGQILAASMHGMPHGRGALRNGFPGHFCIHFYKSTTHQSKKMDLSHQVMVWKAAGKIDEFMDQVDPFELTDLFLIALNQQDLDLLQRTLSEEAKVNLDPLIKKMESVIQVSRTSKYKSLNPDELLAIEMTVAINLYEKERGIQKESLQFTLKRNSLIDRWEIESVTFSN